jgi:excinuclease ABC subunit B
MQKKFISHSSYNPAGDQPAAIEKLIYGLDQSFTKQMLLGVTGCGKTFTLVRLFPTEHASLYWTHSSNEAR